MPEFLGAIEIPEPGSSGTFPLVTSYPWSYTAAPEVAVHPIANPVANLKTEQRFYIGPRAKRFLVRCEMNDARRVLLADFWDARKGAYQAFTYLAPTEAGGAVNYTVRFENEPLSVEHLAAALSQMGVWLVEVPDPASAPTYTIASTVTRLPVHDDTLDTALRAQVQEVIPLVKIVVRESGYAAIYLSDRRVTVGGQLYQPRLLDWSGIQQSIGGSSDLAQFTFGNADRVMTALANSTSFARAWIEFSLLHVGTLIKWDGWAGEIKTWACDEGPEFKISASDGLEELSLPYPIRNVDRRCWKKVADGINCFATGPTTCLKVFLKNAGEAGNDCTILGQILRFGGINVKPQQVGPSKVRTLGSKSYSLTPTTIVNDSAYGQVLPDIYVAPDPIVGTPRPMPVTCLMANGGEEGNGEYYIGMGIVGRGPLDSYVTPATVATADGGQRFAGHTLDGQPHHGHGTDQENYGLRTSLGPVLCDPDGDNFTLLGALPKTYAAGTAWVEIKRTDIKGIQPTKTADHKMEALVAGGLKGWTWTMEGIPAAPVRAATRSVLSNPVWVVVNMLLHAKGLEDGTSAQQIAVFDCPTAILKAAICDNSVLKITPANGTSETQFQFIGVIAEQHPLRDWIQNVLNNCLGFFVNSFGKLKIGIRNHSGSSEGGAFTEGNIIAGSLSLRPFAPEFNWLKGNFGNYEYEWARDYVRQADEDHATLMGGVVPVYTQKEIDLAGTCTKSQAARIVITRLREELGGIYTVGGGYAEFTNARLISFRTTILALVAEAGMICSLTHPDMPGGLGEFRITSWRLNKDFSIDIEGRTTTDSMYDLTVGLKPADVMADPLPGETVIDTMPGDVAIVTVTGSDDGNSQFIDIEYQPPGAAGTDIGTFTDVNVYVEAPDGSALPQFAGGFSYDGDAAGLGENRYGTCRLVLPLTVAEDRRVYIVSRSPVYTKRLVLPAGTCDTNGTTIIRRSGPVFTGLSGTIYVNAAARTIASVTDPDHLELTENVGVHASAGLTGIYSWNMGVRESPNALVSATASSVILNPPAINQTPVTIGANKCRVVLVARNNRTKYQFAGSVTFATSAPNYAYLTKFEVFADNAVGVANDRILGYITPPAAGQGDIVELFYTDEWDLPVGGDETWGLEFRAYNIDNLMTPDPPRVEGLVVPSDSTVPPPAVDPLSIPPVTGFAVTDWGMSADQAERAFKCDWTMPASMANVSAVKLRIATPGLPGGQDVTGHLPFPKVVAGLAAMELVRINRADLPGAAENWTFSCVTINAAGDGDNLFAPAPTAVLSVGPPAGAVPDLMLPTLPATVTGADVGPRILLGNNEPFTWIRATVTLPVGCTATRLLLWVSEDGGITWGNITQVWAVAAGLTFDFTMRVPATAQTDWKVKVTTGNAQTANAESTAVVSAAFSVATVSAVPATGATGASVGTVVYAKDADGLWHWGLTYVKWTTPNDGNFFHSQLTVQLVNALGTPDPNSDLGTERAVDESTYVAIEYTSTGVKGWWIPPASYGYRYHRFRIYGITRNGDRTLYTGCWPAGANYYDVLPTEQTGALQVQRADPTILGPEFSIGVAVAGGTPLLRQSQTNLSNILPNADFQLEHPTSASWVDKWTPVYNATRQTGAETGSYLIRLGYDVGNSAIKQTQPIRVFVGQNYSINVRVKADVTPGGLFYVGATFYKPDMSYASSNFYSIATVGTSWQTTGYTITVPSGLDAYYMEVAFVASPSNGKYYYIDRAEVTLVTRQQDAYDASTTTAVTLGQHLNGDSQFAGIGVKRSTGWETEQRDNYFRVISPSGRSVVGMYGSDAAIDFGEIEVWTDEATPAFASMAPREVYVFHDSTHLAALIASTTASEAGLRVNTYRVVGPQQPMVSSPSADVASLKTAVDALINRLVTHGLIANA